MCGSSQEHNTALQSGVGEEHLQRALQCCWCFDSLQERTHFLFFCTERVTEQSRVVVRCQNAICKLDTDGDVSGGRDCLVWSALKFQDWHKSYQKKRTKNNTQVLHSLIFIFFIYIYCEADWIAVTSDTNKQRCQQDVTNGIWDMTPGKTSIIRNSSFAPKIEIGYDISKNKRHISVFLWEITEFNFVCNQSFHRSPVLIGLHHRCSFSVTLTVFIWICGYSASARNCIYVVFKCYLCGLPTMETGGDVLVNFCK